jgi:hypothetical protein
MIEFWLGVKKVEAFPRTGHEGTGRVEGMLYSFFNPVLDGVGGQRHALVFIMQEAGLVILIGRLL